MLEFGFQLESLAHTYVAGSRSLWPDCVMEHFADKEPEYFLKGIKLLVHRCEKCVEIKGDYIEK
jgi:hypothetical protein